MVTFQRSERVALEDTYLLLGSYRAYWIVNIYDIYLVVCTVY